LRNDKSHEALRTILNYLSAAEKCLRWWVVDSISGELAPSVFRIQALYPRCGYACSRDLPPHSSGQKSSVQIDLTFEGISFLFLRGVIIPFL